MSNDDSKVPEFNYSDLIKDPGDLGSNTQAHSVTSNIAALKAYAKLLMTSDSSANSNPGHALGDQYWLRTSAKCKDPNGMTQTRYIYINHQPVSTDKFFKKHEDFALDGLIPGMISDLFKINPFAIFSAIAEDGYPDCVNQELSSTANMGESQSGNVSEKYESHFITKDDLKNVGPCSFRSRKNPYSGTVCSKKQGFKNIYDLPNDSIVTLYYTSLSILSLYLLYCFMRRVR